MLLNEILELSNVKNTIISGFNPSVLFDYVKSKRKDLNDTKISELVDKELQPMRDFFKQKKALITTNNSGNWILNYNIGPFHFNCSNVRSNQIAIRFIKHNAFLHDTIPTEKAYEIEEIQKIGINKSDFLKDLNEFLNFAEELKKVKFCKVVFNFGKVFDEGNYFEKKSSPNFIGLNSKLLNKDNLDLGIGDLVAMKEELTNLNV